MHSNRCNQVCLSILISRSNLVPRETNFRAFDSSKQICFFVRSPDSLYQTCCFVWSCNFLGVVWTWKTEYHLQKLNGMARIKRSGMDTYFCSLLIQFHFICILPTEAHSKKGKRELKRFVGNPRFSILQ